MLPRLGRALSRQVTLASPAIPRVSSSIISSHHNGLCLRRYTSERLPSELDPGMNGGYVNPPAIKRQFRSPYEDWWDKQDRKNFGEPRHEDEDIMGVFSIEEYTHAKPRAAFLHMGVFISAVLGLCGVVYMFYPDKPGVPRTFGDNGLQTALGGPGALTAESDGE